MPKLSYLDVEANASKFPSPLNDKLDGADLKNLYTLSLLPPRSHNLTAPSAPPVTTTFPLGLKVMQDPLSWAAYLD